ncbi:SulP family inorganic anion transporter [Halanaerobaculum tunisiense]
MNIRNYKFKFLASDLLAGLSVAALSLPQNMAYALIAGVNPVYGLYTSIVSKIIATVVGVSNHMIVGPTNLMAMAIASNLNFVQQGSYLEAVLVLTFLVGVFQLLLGIFKLGNLVNYISHSVIVGLITGTAFIIGVGQLPNLLEVTVGKTPNLFYTLKVIISNLGQVDLVALSLGLLTIAIILIGEQIGEKFPSYLFAISIATLVVYIFNLGDSLQVVGHLPASLPKFQMLEFNFKLLTKLSTKALAVAIVGLIQTLAVVKSLESKTEQEIEINKEFIGQGLINLGTPFYSGFASAGSFTNSFVNYQAGAKTRLAELVAAITIALFLILFNPVVRYIPITGLAALIMIVAVKMIDREEIILNLKADKADSLIFIVTLFATILLPRLEYAIYLGVLISLVVVVKESSKVKMEQMSYDEDSDTKLSYKEPEEVTKDEYVVLDIAGDLNFSAADNLKKELNSLEAKGFVIRVKNIDRIDLTSVKELEKFISKVQADKQQVLLSGVGEDKYEILNELGIISQVGEENVFYTQDEFLSSTIDAVESAENEEVEGKEGDNN